MRLSSLITSSLSIATALAASPVPGPFFLSVVPSNGSDPYPTNVGVGSRGAKFVSSALEWNRQWTFDTDRSRLVPAEFDTGYASGEIIRGAPIGLVAEDGDWPLEVVEIDGESFLINAGETSDVNQWTARRNSGSGPASVDYAGPGSANANAALRLDLEIPAV